MILSEELYYYTLGFYIIHVLKIPIPSEFFPLFLGYYIHHMIHDP